MHWFAGAFYHFRKDTDMKKIVKVASVIAVGAAAGAAISFIKDYRTMKRMEEKMEKMPVHKIKKRLAKVHKSEDETIIEVPKEMVFADRLRVCLHILKG